MLASPTSRRRDRWRHRPGRRPRRRGVVLLESALIYSATLMLILGTMIMGLGIFQYQQLAALAREGSRYASVHGSTYQTEQNDTTATTSGDVMNYILPRAFVMNTTALTCTLNMANGQASVTLNYTWTPQGYWSPIKLTSTSVTPILY